MGTQAPTDRSGVVFDIDGTLLDSNYLHVLAWSAALRDNGFRVEMADIHRAIGLPSEALVQRLVQQGCANLVEAHSEHFERLRDQYGVNAMSGAADLLQRCAESGWTVTLATSGGKSDLDWMRIMAADGQLIRPRHRPPMRWPHGCRTTFRHSSVLSRNIR